MHPILFQIGGLKLYSWGFMVALGFIAGITIGVLRAKKEDIPAEITLDMAMYAMVASIIGARVFYVIGFWNDFLNNPLSVFAVWEGGMVFYGGLIFALLTVIVYCRIKKLSLFKMLDIASPTVAIGYSIGRIGCFLRGCCYGNECSLPWGVHFPELAGFHHPTQIYSSLAGLLIFITLIMISDRKKYDGQVFVWGLTLYSVYRFIIEFFRYSPLYWAWFTPSQWISIGVFVAGIIGILLLRKGQRI